jgi:hypothetical protein
MSITGVSNNTAAWQTANRQKASASPQQPAATASSAVPSESSYDPFRNLSPTDSITVNLPSGLSIGYMHFGTPLDAAGEAQMADAAADLAGRFSGVTGNGATPTSDGTSAASGIPQDDGASDLLHVGMPNGVSFDIRHWSQGIETDAEQNAITDQLTKTAARLADALKAYMSGSSSQSGTGAAAPGSVASAAAARSLMA